MDPYEEIMNDVEIFCARSAHHYGFGVTAEQAFEACKKAGADAQELKRGPKNAKGVIMDRLPAGITKYAVDNMGSLLWKFPEGTGDMDEGTCTRYIFDKKTGRWVEGEPEKPAK